MSGVTAQTLENHALAILEAAMRAVDPADLTARAALDAAVPVHTLVALGKAAEGMASGFVRAAGPPASGGVLIVPRQAGRATDLGSARSARPSPQSAATDPTPLFARFEADHPVPTERNIAAARAVLDAVSALEPGDRLAVLISGGGSALLTLPAEGLGLDDLRRVTDTLLRAGAPINDLNCVRKHTEQLKGGRLAAAAAGRGASVDALILSDVVGDPLDAIASGPTAPDPTTFADALAVLERYEALEASPRLTEHLRAGLRGERPETPKPGDPVFGEEAGPVGNRPHQAGKGPRVRNTIIGNNATALDTAVAAAEKLGYRVSGHSGAERVARHSVAGFAGRGPAAQSAGRGPTPLIEYGVTGDAAEFGRRLGRIARELAADSDPGEAGFQPANPRGAGFQPARPPLCFIAGGETTVDVGPATGRGGRNQEAALAAAIEIDGLEGVCVATLATDGVDGPTDAAGAVATGRTCAHARSLGLDPARSLQNHDSYGFFSRLGAVAWPAGAAGKSTGGPLPHGRGSGGEGPPPGRGGVETGFGGLIRTGPTGTNVNDLALVLVG